MQVLSWFLEMEMKSCCLTDVNLEEQCLTIRRSIRYDGSKRKYIIGPTKRKKVRVVDFGDTLVEIFRNARKEQLKNRMQYGELYHTNYYRRGRKRTNFSPFSVRPAVVKLQRFESSAVFYFRMREVLSLTEENITQLAPNKRQLNTDLFRNHPPLPEYERGRKHCLRSQDKKEKQSLY